MAQNLVLLFISRRCEFEFLLSRCQILVAAFFFFLNCTSLKTVRELETVCISFYLHNLQVIPTCGIWYRKKGETLIVPLLWPISHMGKWRTVWASFPLPALSPSLDAAHKTLLIELSDLPGSPGSCSVLLAVITWKNILVDLGL